MVDPEDDAGRQVAVRIERCAGGHHDDSSSDDDEQYDPPLPLTIILALTMYFPSLSQFTLLNHTKFQNFIHTENSLTV
jgi:hypothetical protein